MPFRRHINRREKVVRLLLLHEWRQVLMGLLERAEVAILLLGEECGLIVKATVHWHSRAYRLAEVVIS